MGRTTRSNYRIEGTGHKLQVHTDDLNIFRGMERGQAFSVGIPEPRIEAMPIAQTQQPVQKYNGGEPELATLERLDESPAPAVVENTPVEYQPLTDIGNHPVNGYSDISNLGLSEAITNMLTLENWSIKKLAEANLSELTAYRGIGEARATQIVESAKQWLEQKQ
jgi:hypothetical protein